MKFCTCGCLFDYFAYSRYGRKGQYFSVMVNRYQKHDVGHTFTFFDLDKPVIYVFFHYSVLKNLMQMTLITN